jgi:hypothetical protein
MSLTLPTRFFPTYPGKAAFGTNQPIQNAGDYILNKKAKNTYCNITLCRPANKIVNQSDLLMLRKSNQLYNKCKSYNFNKTNLNSNLFTKLDLTGIKVIASLKTGKSPTPIIPQIGQSNINYLQTNPYSTLYVIDPCGVLFGNSTCGINNYQNFIVYNPPYTSKISKTNNDIYGCDINL